MVFEHLFRWLSIVAFIVLPVNVVFAGWQRDAQNSGNLTFYTLNDNLNASWTVNTDDYRSFGLGGSRSFARPFDLVIDYYGLTKRKGFPQGEGMRLDELSAAANYRMSYQSGFQRFCLLPGAGLFVAGDLRSQTLQNVVHRTLSLPEVTMQYATHRLWTIILSGAAQYGFTDTVFHGAEFSLSARARYAIRPWYDSRMEIGVFTSVSGMSGDLFRLDFINRYCRLYANDPVLRYVSDAESGWIWRYVVSVGGFYICNEFGLSSGFSTGSVGLKLNVPRVDRPFTSEDFIFECGMLPGKSGWIADIKSHPWDDKRFNLKAEYVFLVPKDVEYPRFRINQQQLSFGGEFTPFPVRQTLTVSPFAGVTGGIFRASRYSGVVDTVVEQHTSPVVTGEIGIAVGGRLPLRFVQTNVIYGVAISDRFTMPVRRFAAECPAGTIAFVMPYNCVPLKVSVAVDF